MCRNVGNEQRRGGGAGVHPTGSLLLYRRRRPHHSSFPLSPSASTGLVPITAILLIILSSSASSLSLKGNGRGRIPRPRLISWLVAVSLARVVIERQGRGQRLCSCMAVVVVPRGCCGGHSCRHRSSWTIVLAGHRGWSS
jgi:hypothetical protein